MFCRKPFCWFWLCFGFCLLLFCLFGSDHLSAILFYWTASRCLKGNWLKENKSSCKLYFKSCLTAYCPKKKARLTRQRATNANMKARWKQFVREAIALFDPHVPCHQRPSSMCEESSYTGAKTIRGGYCKLRLLQHMVPIRNTNIPRNS